MKTLKATKLALLIAVLSGGAASVNAVAADRDATNAANSPEVTAPSAYGERDTVPNDEFLSEEADTFRPGEAETANVSSSSASDSEAEFSATESSTQPSDAALSDSSDGASLASQEAHQVHFEFDSAELSEEAQGALDQLVDDLKGEQRPLAVYISGHTDATGPEEYNKDLAERRAKAVQEYLKDKDIEISSWNVEAPGEESPVASNESREGRQENRRVEIGISGDESADQAVSVVND